MRLPSVRQANAFFAPLRRKTSAFIVDGRETNLQLAQLILNLASSLRWRVLVLDTDTLYATNILNMSEKRHDGTRLFIRIPVKDSELERWLVDSIFAKYELLIIDDLNTLHHLLSALEPRSGTNRLYFIARTLSYLARFDDRAAILTVYKNVREGTGQSTPRSLSKLSDLSISVELEDYSIRFRCNEGSAWANNLFSIRT